VPSGSGHPFDDPRPSYDSDDPPGAEGVGDRPVSGWRRRLFSWPVLAVAGILLYELTTQPALGAVVACAKVGWKDAATALWVRRTDPHRARGRALFWLLAASGLWKVAMTAAVVMFGLGLVAAERARQGPRGGGEPPALAALGAEMFVGFTLSGMATCAGFGLALRHRLRLWISPGLHAARRAGEWPPTPVLAGTSNRARGLALTTVFLFFTPAALIALVSFVILVQPPRAPLWLAPSVCVASMFGGPALLLWITD
jgi:hypothetical protein